MKKMELLEWMSEIDDTFIEEANMETGMKKSRVSLTGKIGAAVAAVFVLSVCVPNLSAQAAQALSGLPVVGGYFEAVTFRHYSYMDERREADIQVPQLTVDTLGMDEETAAQAQETADAVNLDIEQTVEELKTKFSQSLEQDGVQTTEVTYKTVTDNDRWYCLRLSMFEASADGYEHDRFYTISKQTGRLVTLAELFDGEDYDYVAELSGQIKEQMRAQMAEDDAKVYWLDSEFPDDDFQSIDAQTQFYINEDNQLVIYFAEGEVAPMYMGEVEFVMNAEIPSEPLN